MCLGSMEDKYEQGTIPFDSGFGGSRTGGATAYNYSNRPEEARQERLQFDMDTGRLVVNNPPAEDQAVVPARFGVPDRPVLDKMASQGFFLD